VANLLVLVVNLLQTLFNFSFERVSNLILSFQLLVLVLNLAIQIVDVELDVAELVSVQLELSFTLQGHVFDLTLIRLVLLLDVFNLILSILFDLINSLLVLDHDLLDVSVLLLNLSVLDFHLLTMALLFDQHIVLVVLADLLQTLLKVATLLIFLSLKLLELGSLDHHSLREVISFGLDLLLLRILPLSVLVLIVGDSLPHVLLERFVLVFFLHAALLDVSFEQTDPVELSLHLELFLDTVFISFLQVFELLNEGILLGDVHLHFLLLS